MDNKQRAEIDQFTQHYRTSFQPSVEAGLGRLHARMAAEKPQASRRPWMGIAASLALLAVAAFGLRAWINSNNNQFATADFTKEIVLPDGTLVTLNHDSELELTEDFNIGERRIQFEGEGFFQVASNPDRPFILQQGDLELRVVGTAFNLATDPESGSLLVEVSEGKVRLSSDDEAIEVGAQQCGMRASNNDELHLVAAPHLNRHAWRTGQLLFKDTPLQIALPAIAASYRINWEMSDQFLTDCGDLPFTARFDQDPIEDVIATLSLQFGLTIDRIETSNGYRISGNCLQ